LFQLSSLAGPGKCRFCTIFDAGQTTPYAPDGGDPDQVKRQL
jgi:hypothetical protein